MKFFKFALLLTALSLFILACTETDTTKTSPAGDANKLTNTTPAQAQPTTTVDELASTRKIYTDMCARCHKEDGTGGKTEIEGTTINAENLSTDKMKKMADAKYIEYIKNGIPDEGMPAFKDRLTEDEIKSVIKFIRTEFQGK
jgi:mono/diheme cytochrome c family protein